MLIRLDRCIEMLEARKRFLECQQCANNDEALKYKYMIAGVEFACDALKTEMALRKIWRERKNDRI